MTGPSAYAVTPGCREARDRLDGRGLGRDLRQNVGWQGRGIGSAMLARAEGDMATARHTLARVEAALSSVPFYEKSAYLVVGNGAHQTRGGMLLTSAHLEQRIGG